MKVLIFGTCYVATPERQKLTSQWAALHRRLNPECDLLLVDSASPIDPLENMRATGGVYTGCGYLMKFYDADGIRVQSFTDNIGHLSHDGRDGWGRAFCHGLKYAIEAGYDVVAHVEGDSLFRLPVMSIGEQMERDGIRVASVPIGYGEAQRSTWVETGLMFFEVDYLRKSNFIAGYDWPNRTAKPQPEIVIRRMLGEDLVMLPLKAERSDKGEITVDNVTEFDWITHCAPEVYERFESVL